MRINMLIKESALDSWEAVILQHFRVQKKGLRPLTLRQWKELEA